MKAQFCFATVKTLDSPENLTGANFIYEYTHSERSWNALRILRASEMYLVLFQALAQSLLPLETPASPLHGSEWLFC